MSLPLPSSAIERGIQGYGRCTRDRERQRGGEERGRGRREGGGKERARGEEERRVSGGNGGRDGRTEQEREEATEEGERGGREQSKRSLVPTRTMETPEAAGSTRKHCIKSTTGLRRSTIGCNHTTNKLKSYYK